MATKRNQLSRWKVGKTNQSPICKMTEEKQLAIQKLSENEVVKLYDDNYQLIQKTALMNIMQLKEQMLTDLLSQDNIDLAQKILELNLRTSMLIEKKVNDMIAYEDGKLRPSKEIKMFCINALLENNKLLFSELRKGNEGQHKMKHGDKRTNINVEVKQSLDDWMDDKKKEEAVVVESQPVVEGDKKDEVK